MLSHSIDIPCRNTHRAKSLGNNKIVPMTAAINELKGQLKLLPQLAAAVAKGDKDKKKKKGQKTKNKKNMRDQVKQRRTRRGKKSCQKRGRSTKKNMMDVPNTGASTTWCGQCTPPRIVASGKRAKERRLQTWQPSQPLQPPRSIQAIKPFFQPLPNSKMRRNDGSSQHRCAHSNC